MHYWNEQMNIGRNLHMCSETVIETAKIRKQQRILFSLQWRHNKTNSFSNLPLHDCVCSRLFRHRSKNFWMASPIRKKACEKIYSQMKRLIISTSWWDCGILKAITTRCLDYMCRFCVSILQIPCKLEFVSMFSCWCSTHCVFCRTGLYQTRKQWNGGHVASIASIYLHMIFALVSLKGHILVCKSLFEVDHLTLVGICRS